MNTGLLSRDITKAFHEYDIQIVSFVNVESFAVLMLVRVLFHDYGLLLVLCQCLGVCANEHQRLEVTTDHQILCSISATFLEIDTRNKDCCYSMPISISYCRN